MKTPKQTNKQTTPLPYSSPELLRALLYPEVVPIFQLTATLWHFREITPQ